MKKLFFAFIFLLITTSLHAHEIQLTNGDRISGKIVSETDSQVTIDTRAMGRVTIDRNFIKTEEAAKPAVSADSGSDIAWKKELSVGYSQSGGNTEKSLANVGVNVSRKTSHDEWSGKYTAYYSSSEKRMDGRKFYGMLRYAYSYGQNLKWYHFYKLEGDQDRFSNIDYRISPQTGLGYWFADRKDWKALAEMAVGFEHTNYRDNTESDNEAILVPRGFFEKQLTDSFSLREDAYLYPSLSDVGEYRLRSESSLVGKINEQMSWKLSFQDDYDSDPGGSAKKNDYRLVTSIDYNF